MARDKDFDMSFIPNLDAESAEDLMRAWDNYRHATNKECAHLVGDTRKGYTTIVRSLLSGYAANKATAISCRLRGDIRAALVYERVCDTIYEEIPQDLRW